MDLYQIIYSSKNCIAGTPNEVEQEIQSILQASRKNNNLDGITGALLFNGHGFAQVLEGTLDAIEKTYERIQCDSRHSEVVLLSNGVCGARTFSDWSMAYVDSAYEIRVTSSSISMQSARIHRLAPFKCWKVSAT